MIHPHTKVSNDIDWLNRLGTSSHSMDINKATQSKAKAKALKSLSHSDVMMLRFC